jgi:hypothetical protein
MRCARPFAGGLVVLVACGSRAQPALAPSPPPSAPADAALALAPSTELEPGDPPPSAPIGEPIAIVERVPKVDDAWQLVTDNDLVIDAVWDGGNGHKRQHTTRYVDYRLRVLDVTDGHPSKLQVQVSAAHEVVDVNAQHQEEELLHGGYVVATGGTPDHVGHGGITGERNDGAPLGDREREELEDLFTATLTGRTAPLLQILAAAPLRLHETRVLEPEQARAMIFEGPDGARMSVALTAVDTAHHRATFQLDVVAHDTGASGAVDSARVIVVYDTTTGSPVEDRSVARRIEHLADMTQTSTARVHRER